MGDLISREFMKSIGGACIAQRLKDGDLCPIISIDLLPSVESEQCGDSDKIYAIMKDYYFEHKDIHDASWQAGFIKCMNLIPNVFDKVER